MPSYKLEPYQTKAKLAHPVAILFGLMIAAGMAGSHEFPGAAKDYHRDGQKAVALAEDIHAQLADPNCKQELVVQPFIEFASNVQTNIKTRDGLPLVRFSGGQLVAGDSVDLTSATSQIDSLITKNYKTRSGEDLYTVFHNAQTIMDVSTRFLDKVRGHAHVHQAQDPLPTQPLKQLENLDDALKSLRIARTSAAQAPSS